MTPNQARAIYHLTGQPVLWAQVDKYLNDEINTLHRFLEDATNSVEIARAQGQIERLRIMLQFRENAAAVLTSE